mgnify:FL=1
MDSAHDHVPSHHPILLQTLSENGCACCALRSSTTTFTITTTTSIIKMGQRYVDATVNDMSLLNMGEC